MLMRGYGRLARAFCCLALLTSMESVAETEERRIDPTGWELSFNEEFEQLDVSAWGPGTRWIAHTPWNGDFGDQVFGDPREGFPFVMQDGVLRIEARKLESTGRWYSGLLASVDQSKDGFSQKYGYFEMRAKLPRGPGLWPAFWLMGVDSSEYAAEIDVLEHHGHSPSSFASTVHVWDKTGAGRNNNVHGVINVIPGSLYDDYNTYGVLIDHDLIRIFFNREEVWRTQTPSAHRQPMYILLNLALGSGFPTDKTPNPSFMWVDYVRVWKLPESARP